MMPPLVRHTIAAVAVVLAIRFIPAAICGHDAQAVRRGELTAQSALAEELVAFEARDDARSGTNATSPDRFIGEWALVTHQMVTLGLAQICLAHPEMKPRYVPVITRAATKTFLPEMRDFGTRAWQGEDAFASVDSPHGHAYLAWSAIAVSMARVLDPAFPGAVAAQHDALIRAYERRLLASPTGLIETYPGEAYPTDVAAVAGAIAAHGRATGLDHHAVLARWADRVRAVQIEHESGFVFQRMGALDGRPHDAPRGSGSAAAAYFAGFADRALARQLAEATLRHESTLLGFGAIREYGAGHDGRGDVDSGPVLFGVSVAATGFALAPARSFGHQAAFERLYRTADLFGMPVSSRGATRFTTGGPIGNALLLAMLTSGPELAP